MIEIERKFLVKSNEYKELAYAKKAIAQGYLNSDPLRTVRIRINEESGFLTIKGKSSASGTTRLEWEKEIPVNEARLLLEICEGGIIQKTRFLVKSGSHIIEVDEFSAENEGLVFAEIELKDENEFFEKPSWLGDEVTNDHRYYNSWLSQNPYITWK
jgi:CYTH domain-containing protein